MYMSGLMEGLLSVITHDSGQFEYDHGSVQTQDFPTDQPHCSNVLSLTKL